MTNKALSVTKICISQIQLKLSDFLKSDPNTGKIITERFTERTQPHNINHFDLVNPVCPLCGSNHMTKQGHYERNPILDEFGPQKIYLKGICVKSAGKKFITPFDSVVYPKHRYASVFKDGVFRGIKHKYQTSRGILAYLARKMEYWTVKFGPVLEHHVM